MPKKHKSKGANVSTRHLRPVERKDGRIKRIERWGDDIADDEVGHDAFELQHDRVSIDLDERRRTQLEEADALGMGDEVVALDLPEASSDEGVDEDEADDLEDEISLDEAERRPPARQRVPQDHQPLPVRDGTSRFSRADHAYVAADPEPVPLAEEDPTEITGSYHVGRYEDEEPDSSDEEAVALNLAETRRLQLAARDLLVDDDFGIPRVESSPKDVPDEELLPVAKRSQPAGPAFASRDHAIAHLLSHSPEVLSLVDDFASCTDRLGAAELEVDVQEQEHGADHPSVATAALYHHVLLTYLCTLAFYFRLLATPSSDSKLRQKVLSRLTALRQGVASLDEQGVGDPEAIATTLFQPDSEDDVDDHDDEDLDSELEDELAELVEHLNNEGIDIDDLADGQLASLVEDMRSVKKREPVSTQANGISKPKASSAKGQGKRAAVGAPETTQAPPSKRRRKRNKRQKEAPTLPPLPTPPPQSHTVQDDFSDAADLLDPTSLSSVDAAEKAKSKHSLRFHARRIDQTASRRAAARSGGGIGGDDDVPYRSRERSRAAVQAREQVKKNRQAGSSGKGAGLDAEDWGDADWGAAEGVRASESTRTSAPLGDEDALGYYDLVKRTKTDKAAQKKAAYDAGQAAERAELATTFAEASAKGPRAVSRAILANKGLTPKRKKENRNPRVKKKLRYDKAKKKVATMGRALFKGRPHDYEGEKSGISRRTVKSVKLGGA